MRGPVPAGNSPAIRRRRTLSGAAPGRTVPVPDRRHRPDAGNPGRGIEKQYGSGPRRTPRWRPGGDAFDELESEIGIVFDRRSDLVKLIAVADAGGILAAAERLAITQPALSRVIARLEIRFGGRLFERLPSGVRLTPLGTVAAERARHVLREIEAAEAKIGAAVSGRSGRFRITADPMWMEAVVAPAIARFRDTCPGIELTLRTASLAEALRLTHGRRKRPALRRHRRRRAPSRIPPARTRPRHDRRDRRPCGPSPACRQTRRPRPRLLAVDRLRRNRAGRRCKQRPAFPGPGP